jgi:hypothetical protein
MASVDDVHNLLNAVNTVTLKRMEDKTDAINAVTLKRIEERNDRAIGELRAALNVELGEIQHRLGQVMRKLDIPFEPAPPKS